MYMLRAPIPNAETQRQLSAGLDTLAEAAGTVGFALQALPHSGHQEIACLDVDKGGTARAIQASVTHVSAGPRRREHRRGRVAAIPGADVLDRTPVEGMRIL